MDGSQLTNVTSDLVNDTSPELGANLDTNTHEIVTASNRNLILRPNGTGAIQLGGNTNPAELRLYCENSDAHYVALKSPTHSELSGGSVTWRLPTADASNSGDALVSDGSGNLSFSTIGGSSLQLDTTPKTSSFSASFGYIYLVNAQNSNSVVSINLPAVTGQYNRFRVFNFGLGSVQFTTSSPANTLTEYEGTVGTVNKQKTFNSNCIIDVFLINNVYEWIVSPQLEIEDESAFSASGEFLVFDNTTKKMTPSSYSLPTSIGTPGQVLTVNGSNVAFQSISSGGASAPAVTTPTLNADYTITTTTGIREIFAFTSSANRAITLPTASTAGEGYQYDIKSLSAVTFTVTCAGSDTIDGTSTTFDLTDQYSSLSLVADATNNIWYIV